MKKFIITLKQSNCTEVLAIVDAINKEEATNKVLSSANNIAKTMRNSIIRSVKPLKVVNIELWDSFSLRVIKGNKQYGVLLTSQQRSFVDLVRGVGGVKSVYAYVVKKLGGFDRIKEDFIIYVYDLEQRIEDERNKRLNKIKERVIELQNIIKNKQIDDNLEIEVNKIIEELYKCSMYDYIIEENIKIINLNIKDKKIILENILLEILRCIPLLQNINNYENKLKILSEFKLLTTTTDVIRCELLKNRNIYSLLLNREEKEQEKEYLINKIGKFEFFNVPSNIKAFKNYKLYEGLKDILKDLYVGPANKVKEQKTINNAYKYIFEQLKIYDDIKNSDSYKDEISKAYDGYIG